MIVQHKFPLLIFSVLLLVSLTASSAVSADLVTLRQIAARLEMSGAKERYPAEFVSFRESNDAAESLATDSAQTQASRLIEFAILKGTLLEGKLTEFSKQSPDSLQTADPSSGELSKSSATKSDPSVAIFANLTSRLQSTPASEIFLKTALNQSSAEQLRIRTILPLADALRGGEQTYVVKKGDAIRVVAARLGVNWRTLAKQNGLDVKAPILKTGMKLQYNNRKIVPKKISNGLLVNIPDRTLYLFKGGKISQTASVTVGMPKLAIKPEDEDVSPEEMMKWQTPTGIFKITEKSKDPIWTVPPSIQEEMRLQGKEVLVKVPPGKDNPLGRYALRTSIEGIMLHSTNTPSSIYGFNSHGCIRVFPEAMEDIFRSVDVNTKGEIIYMPVKVAVTDDRRVFLEVHRDVYAKTKNMHKEVKRLVSKYKVADLVDWIKVDQLLRQQTGIAEDITRKM